MVVMMRRSLVAAGATLASGLSGRNSGGAELAGRALPELAFKLGDGTARSLAEYRGRGVVLNFWATWCVPCVEEMPSLDALAGAVGDRVAVLAASSDRGGAVAVQRFYASRKVANLAVLLDPMGASARAVGITGIPVTLLIDAEGRERGRVEGAADWGSAASIAMARALAG